MATGESEHTRTTRRNIYALGRMVEVGGARGTREAGKANETGETTNKRQADETHAADPSPLDRGDPRPHSLTHPHASTSHWGGVFPPPQTKNDSNNHDADEPAALCV